MVFAQCRADVFATGGRLLTAAKADGGIDPSLELDDVFKLVSTIARSGEGAPDGAQTSGRLLDLAIRGLSAEGRGASATDARPRTPGGAWTRGRPAPA
jgi:hypothetical protein